MNLKKNGKGQLLYKKAKTIIPGGTQLLTKRPEFLLPELWPVYYKKAKGCYVWDLEGIKFTDMSYMGIGSCILGYADPDIDAAVNKAVARGNMCTLNAPEEVELAELLCKLHPWAEMARFARTGGEAMSVAVRIARAHTKKDIVLFCGYHGWHDWYISSNLASIRSLDGHLLPGLDPAGVPRNLKGTTYPFKFNDTSGFLELIRKHERRIAAVVLEPIRNHFPDKEFLETIRNITGKLGIVLIVDEITAGFRLNNGGAHLYFGLNPDIAVFAKGMSNGFPMSAIIGRRSVMNSAKDSFISSTYWTDRLGPAAALATIKKIIVNNVTAHLISTGKRIQDIWKIHSKSAGIKITISGMCPLCHFSFEYKDPLILKTLFTQLMLERGYLAVNAFYASYAHSDKDINGYSDACKESFSRISKAINSGTPAKLLKAQVCCSGFKRIT